MKPDYILFLFLLNGAAWTAASEFILGENCPPSESSPMDCRQVGHTDMCDEIGFIQTKDYPEYLFDLSYMGNYYFILTSCPKSYIILEVLESDYSFQSESSITIGEGDVIGENILLPTIENTGISINYTSSTNKIWLRFYTKPSLQDFRLRIKYIVAPEMGGTSNYTDPTGSIESPNFGEVPYPAGVYYYFINYEAANYQDILVTVATLDIDGEAGDYLRIGGGSYVSEETPAYLLSWNMNKGYSILINNREAFIVFKSSVTKTGNHQGFRINYKYIDKNITTPVPTTTTEPPEPTCNPARNTTIVFIDVETSQEVRQVMAALLNCSAYNSGYGNEMVTPISEDSIVLSNIGKCNSRWNVDPSTCFQIDIVVNTLNGQGGCVFEKKRIEAAVKSSCNTFTGIQISLPGDFLDIYLISILVCSGVIIIIIVILLCTWKEKLRQHYRQQRKFYENQITKMERENDARMMSTASNAFDIHIQKGVDNPNFEMDDDQFGGILDWDYNPTTTSLSISPTSTKFAKRLSSLISTGSTSSRDDNVQYGSLSSASGSVSSSGNRTSSTESSSSSTPRQIVPKGILKTNKAKISELEPNMEILNDDDIIEFDRYIMQNKASSPEQNQGRLFYDLGYGDQRDSIGETHL